jgi:hypothetical protein
MSLSYSNLPVYVGAANASTISETSAYITATQANVSFSTSSAGKRLLGSAVDSDDQFKFTNALGANISFSFFLETSLDDAGGTFQFLTGTHQDKYFPIQLGTNLYKDCYLSDYSVSVAPYVPVTLSANFICLNPVTGGQVSGDPTPYGGGAIPYDSDDIIYGHTCTVTNMGEAVGNVQSQISYNKRYNRTPIYTLGSINATDMLLDGVESEMSITSTGLENLISYSGNKLTNTVQVNLKDVDGNSCVNITSVDMSAGARVLTEGYNINGGDTLSASATIKEINL